MFVIAIVIVKVILKFPLVTQVEGKTGILDRNDVGFLAWHHTERVNKNLSLGSRLKTPSLPIWVTWIEDSWGVLFNANMDLLKSHSAENR